MSTESARPEIEWVVSASPHVRSPETTARIMWTVTAMLMPAAAWSIVVFGWYSLHVMVLSVLTCVVTEHLCNNLRKTPSTLPDGSAVLTGLLLAFVLPAQLLMEKQTAIGTVLEPVFLDWKVPVLGAIFAIAIVKHCFGGLGHNIWNPALAGRAFVQLSFAADVSPARWPWVAADAMMPADAMTAPTSLAKASAGHYSLLDLFFGNCPGSLGEVSAFLLLLGAVYLIYKKYVNWRLPLAYMVTLVLFATLFAWSPREGGVAAWANEFAGSFQGFRQGKVAFGSFLTEWSFFSCRQLFSGGLVLGALYMATDMVTSPLSSRGQLYFGIGCGLLTALIRSFSGMPEGVCYAILLMNTVRPYIDRISRQKVLGESKG